MGVLRHTSAYCILPSTIPCSIPYKKYTTVFTPCPHLTWPRYILDKTLTIVASKWVYSRAKALMSSASLHNRIPSLYLSKIGQGNPSRDFLRGNKKLEEESYRHPIPRFSCCCCCCCCWNMVRDVGAVTWGIEACVAFVMRIFVKQIGVLGLSGSWSGYTRSLISFIQSLQKALFFLFLFFCFLGLW